MGLKFIGIFHKKGSSTVVRHNNFSYIDSNTFHVNSFCVTQEGRKIAIFCDIIHERYLIVNY